MDTRNLTYDERYELVVDARSSGLSDSQWCMEHGINIETFYTWIYRLRKKACYEIPPKTVKDSYRRARKQDVVKMEIIPEHEECLPVAQPSCPAAVPVPVSLQDFPSPPAKEVMEIRFERASVKVTNDISPLLFTTLLRAAGGDAC